MFRTLTRLLWAATAVACVASPVAAQSLTPSRSLTVDDIVSLEAFGRGTISPDGRWAIYEKRGAYDTIPRFDFAQRSPWAIMDLWVVDLDHPSSAPVRLLPGEGPGLLRVSWSPSGARLLIYRFRDGGFEAGIVTMADRSVQWTGLTPEIPPMGASAEWVSDEAVILLTRPDGSLPRVIRYFSGSQGRMTEAWERSALGHDPSRTVIEADAGVARAEDAEPTQALVRIDLKSGDRAVLVEGPVTDFALSPDRRRLAIVQAGEPLPITAGPILQADGTYRQRLSLLELSTRQRAVALTAWDIAPHLLRWSPDSRSVLVWGRRDGDAWSQGDLLRASGTEITPTDEEGLAPESDVDVLRGVRADWLNGEPILYARPQEGARRDWYLLASGSPPKPLTSGLGSAPSQLATTERNAVSLIADGALWRLTAAGLRRMTARGSVIREAVPSDPELVARLRFNDAARRGWVPVLGELGESEVVSPRGQTLRLGLGQGAETRVLAVSPTASLVLVRDGLVETLRLRTRDGDYRLDAVNDRLSGVAFPAPLPVSHLDPLGRPAKSWLFLPPGGLSPATRGMIVQVYPGATETGFWSGPLTLTYGLRAEVLAAAGFAVLSPMVPADDASPNTADFRLASVDLAVDAALSAWPVLPKGRMAVIGHSFGGFTALEIAARSTRFRSYVVSSALSDMFGGWGEFDAPTRIQPEDGFQMRGQQGWVEAGQGKLGSTPWADPDAYVAASPFLVADRITAPVLLITADLDYVPMSQAERVFSVLYRQGRSARLVTYWGEHHALWSPANIRDRYEEIFDWLDITLPKEPQGAVPTVAPAPLGREGTSADPGEAVFPGPDPAFESRGHHHG